MYCSKKCNKSDVKEISAFLESHHLIDSTLIKIDANYIIEWKRYEKMSIAKPATYIAKLIKGCNKLFVEK